MPPKLGILAMHPIQYQAPLFRRLSARGKIALDVLYLSDEGLHAYEDVGFRQFIAWDIDLMSGYNSDFLSSSGPKRRAPLRAWRLARWLAAQDVVVVHGFTHPWMLIAMVLCKLRRTPYLLRGDSKPRGRDMGWRRHVRDLLARSVVKASAGGLGIGQLNCEFYRQFGTDSVYWAPYSIDNERFAEAGRLTRAEILSPLGLDSHRPLLLFVGKLVRNKRPQDLVAALPLLSSPVTALFVGDGDLREHLREVLPNSAGAAIGFVNQADLPSYYQAADILVLPSESEQWGLVINEAMAAGVIPVVSEQVGAAPDLVTGVGEVFRQGDVQDLARAIERALEHVSNVAWRAEVRGRVAPYSLDATCSGFEEATMTVAGKDPRAGVHLPGRR